MIYAFYGAYDDPLNKICDEIENGMSFSKTGAELTGSENGAVMTVPVTFVEMYDGPSGMWTDPVTGAGIKTGPVNDAGI